MTAVANVTASLRGPEGIRNPIPKLLVCMVRRNAGKLWGEEARKSRKGEIQLSPLWSNSLAALTVLEDGGRGSSAVLCRHLYRFGAAWDGNGETDCSLQVRSGDSHGKTMMKLLGAGGSVSLHVQGRPSAWEQRAEVCSLRKKKNAASFDEGTR